MLTDSFSYLGKSTGDGALAIWTHHLKDVEFLDYHSAYYTGKAIKMGAGVQGFETYAAADKEWPPTRLQRGRSYLRTENCFTPHLRRTRTCTRR